jgi:hypothetical protein
MKPYFYQQLKRIIRKMDNESKMQNSYGVIYNVNGIDYDVRIYNAITKDYSFVIILN